MELIYNISYEKNNTANVLSVQHPIYVSKKYVGSQFFISTSLI